MYASFWSVYLIIISIKVPRIYEISQNFKDDPLEAYQVFYSNLSRNFQSWSIFPFLYCRFLWHIPNPVLWRVFLSICRWLISSFDILTFYFYKQSLIFDFWTLKSSDCVNIISPFLVTNELTGWLIQCKLLHFIVSTYKIINSLVFFRVLYSVLQLDAFYAVATSIMIPSQYSFNVKSCFSFLWCNRLFVSTM